jgi:hypothetical protein
MSTISAGTTSTTALVSTGDTTGNLILATGATPTTALTLNSTTQAATFAGTLATASQGITKASMPAGSVLQVVQTTKTDTFTTTSTTYVDITGFSVSITPTTNTSKILVMYNMEIGGASLADSNHVYLQLYRNSTAIFIADTAGSRTSATSVVNTPTGGTMYPSNCAYLDSPATTSSVTYKVQIKSSNTNTACVNRSGRDTDLATYDGRAVSSITLMEVAA